MSLPREDADKLTVFSSSLVVFMQLLAGGEPKQCVEEVPTLCLALGSAPRTHTSKGTRDGGFVCS